MIYHSAVKHKQTRQITLLLIPRTPQAKKGFRPKKNWMYIHLATFPKVLSPPPLACTLGHPQPRQPPINTPNTPPQSHLQAGLQYGESSISDNPKYNYQIKRGSAKTVSLPLNSNKRQHNGFWTADYISHCAASNAEQQKKSITKTCNRRSLPKLSNTTKAVK